MSTLIRRGFITEVQSRWDDDVVRWKYREIFGRLRDYGPGRVAAISEKAPTDVEIPLAGN